jgi:hypothetical protein
LLSKIENLDFFKSPPHDLMPVKLAEENHHSTGGRNTASFVF